MGHAGIGLMPGSGMIPERVLRRVLKDHTVPQYSRHRVSKIDLAWQRIERRTARQGCPPRVSNTLPHATPTAIFSVMVS